MLSIKKFIDSTTDRAAAALLTFCTSLLATIRQHSVAGDQEELEQFRQELMALDSQLRENPSPDRIHQLAGSTCRLVEEYSVRTGRFVRAQSIELQAMLRMLTSTIADIGQANESTVIRLHCVQRQLEQTIAAEDIRVLKVQLSECLESVRKETIVQREQGERQVSVLRAEVSRSQDRIEMSRTATADPITGFPSRIAAEEAIAEAMAAKSQIFAMVFVLERIRLMNLRFGFGVGDKMVLAYAQHLSEHLMDRDQIFRWSGPSFVVLIERAGSLDAVRKEAQNICSARLEREFDAGSRNALLTVAASCAVFPLAPIATAHAMSRKIDAFVASLHQSEGT